MSTKVSPPGSGLLGDTAARDYTAKLQQFNAFAAPELQQLITRLKLQTGMRVLDAGCGAGDALHWLASHVGPAGQVVGIELSAAHARLAVQRTSANVSVLQADLRCLPLAPASFDVAWCANTVHHLRSPTAGLQQLVQLLRPGGCVALLQSALLPEMVFAWDSRLERKVTAAVRRYYQQRYGLSERDLAGVRNIIGLLRLAGLANIHAHTIAIERIAPLPQETRDYLLETIFRNTWGERLKPFMEPADYLQLRCYCDPAHPQFVLERPDFHYLQTLTMVTAQRG